MSLEQLGEESLAGLLKGMTVVGIGPGLGQEGTTPEFVRAFVERVSLPMVIDADALNALAGKAELLKRLANTTDAKGKKRTIVLTPHPGEMARLVESSVKEVEADRVGLARRFATENGVTLVLKGWRTLVAHPDGRIAVNTTGNPAMAKGGSGDILTGIVAGDAGAVSGAGCRGGGGCSVSAWARGRLCDAWRRMSTRCWRWIRSIICGGRFARGWKMRMELRGLQGSRGVPESGATMPEIMGLSSRARSGCAREVPMERWRWAR